MRMPGWAAAVALAIATLSPTSAVALQAAPPGPVHAPKPDRADPGLLSDGGSYYVFATGNRISRGSSMTSWQALASQPLDVTTLPPWVDRSRGIWAPDVWRIGTTFVMYYSAAATGFGGQRCIGVATATAAEGPYSALTRTAPLVCPSRHGADDPVAGRPVRDAGVIDPSPFLDTDGRRYLLYKTQQRPSSLRILRLGASGMHAARKVVSHELHRSSGIIENPVLLRHGDRYVLFASRYGFNNCSYATVYLTAKRPADLASAPERLLLSTRNTGICGPGGADIALAKGSASKLRMVLHGWVCGSGVKPCSEAEIGNPAVAHRRALYAARLGFRGDTPVVDFY